jgi:hypothetical protein
VRPLDFGSVVVVVFWLSRKQRDYPERVCIGNIPSKSGAGKRDTVGLHLCGVGLILDSFIVIELLSMARLNLD